jgi:hypothetical protein
VREGFFFREDALCKSSVIMIMEGGLLEIFRRPFAFLPAINLRQLIPHVVKSHFGLDGYQPAQSEEEGRGQ